MNAHIDIYSIGEVKTKRGNTLTWLEISNEGHGEVNLWLTPEGADKLRAGLDELFPPAATDGAKRLIEPFVADPVRDAAPTDDLSKPRGIDDLIAPVHEALAAKYHAQTMDFIAAKLGISL